MKSKNKKQPPHPKPRSYRIRLSVPKLSAEQKAKLLGDDNDERSGQGHKV
jgi:hypothetical protein